MTFVLAAQEGKSPQGWGGLVTWFGRGRASGTAPSEALALAQHGTGRYTPLLRPPPLVLSGATGGSLLSWLPSALLVAVAGEGIASLVDPALPGALLGGSAAVATVAAVLEWRVLPALRRLPVSDVARKTSDRRLLRQHSTLVSACDATATMACADVRVACRLHGLTSKMEAVEAVDDAPQLYGARLARVTRAANIVRARLVSRGDSLQRLARARAILEVELELGEGGSAWDQSPEMLQEAAAIEEAIATDTEGRADEARICAEAADEVERLLA